MQRYDMVSHSHGFMGSENVMEPEEAGDWVKYEDAQAALAAKDAEIEALRKEVEGLTETVTHDLKLIAPLRAKCAAMRDLLDECKAALEVPNGVSNQMADKLVAKIDAILGSEE